MACGWSKARRARCRRTRASARPISETSLLLEVESLEVAYGEIAAVRGVSFHVAEGEIVTLIGANGAGKSTTMRGVAGSMSSRKGKILFDGVDVTRLPAHARTAAGIALVPEGR